MSNRLDGVIGDARKRFEPNWVTGRERMYQPVCRCAMHQLLERVQERAMERATPDVETDIGRD